MPASSEILDWFIEEYDARYSHRVLQSRRLPMDNTDLDRLIEQRLDALLPKKLAELREQQTPSMTIIATKGTLDWAYPPFILSSTAAALGWNVSIFFTFYGLELLKKDIS